jgi:hypothetical protein
MISTRFRAGRSLRRLAPAWLAAAGLWAFPALAGDRPATPEGAEALKALIAKYLPGAQAGPAPLVTVTSEGSHYLISADLRALNALLKDTGVSYDPAPIAYQAVEQDDGKWRLAMDSLPRIAFHPKGGSGSVELTNFRAAALIDPAIAWLLSGSASMDKGVFQLQNAKLDQRIDFGPVQETVATNVAADGAVSTQVKEEIADIALKATGAGAHDSPINFSARAEKALVNLGVEGFRSHKAFDLWGLVAAHPTRADLAAHEAELKGLLKELTVPGLKLEEGLEAQKTVVTASLGAIALADLKYRFVAANAGPQSSVSLSLSAEGLSLPVGLVPPNAGALTPSKIDVKATLKGVDIAAAANEWISGLSLAGDGPILSEDNADKVEAALLSAGPIRIEFAPSHIVAPAFDADFAGVVRLDHDKPTAAITVHMRGFDITMAAVKALGPDIAAKALPGLALAKGLGKTESDGSLSWLVELGADRSLKVNGIPFGKAPD